jgi:hypothetical protein
VATVRQHDTSIINAPMNFFLPGNLIMFRNPGTCFFSAPELSSVVLPDMRDKSILHDLCIFPVSRELPQKDLFFVHDPVNQDYRENEE